METDRVEFVLGEDAGDFCFFPGVVLPFCVAAGLRDWALDGGACFDRRHVCFVGGEGEHTRASLSPRPRIAHPPPSR